MTLVSAFVFSLCWASICNLVIEVLQAVTDFHAILDVRLQTSLAQFLLGAAVIWVVLALLMSLSGRLWAPCALLLTAAVIVGFANHEKLSLRGEPLYPSDLEFVRDSGFLLQMVPLRAVLLLCGFIVVTIIGFIVIARASRRRFPRIHRSSQPRLWWTLTALRPLAAVGAVMLLAYAAAFNTPGNGVRAAYEGTGVKWAYWHQTRNYKVNGFIGGLLYNTKVPAMTRPARYSAETMSRIVDRYTRRAAKVNAHRDPAALDDVNVVSILSETFSDPTRVRGVSVSTDPIPNTRRTMARTWSGNMLAQKLGGGTANMEFEALTGMSLSQFTPQMNTPYQMLVPRFSDFPSAVGYFKQHGHVPIAVHPFTTSLYRRKEVYPILGFEQFIHDTTMHSAQKLERSHYISDRSAFSEVTYQIEQSDDPLFVNLVTMQNHFPMKDLYDDPVPVSGLSGDAQDEAEGYARGLQYTDQALKDFLRNLTRSPEKTLVIFYGDHLPAFWPADVQRRNGIRRMRETPFFLWSNFTKLAHRKSPTTSPIYFLPDAFDMVGAPLPPYYVLLRELQSEIPAMEQGVYIDRSDAEVSKDDLSPKARRLLADFRLVQYDLAVGKRYCADRMFYDPARPVVTAQSQ